MNIRRLGRTLIQDTSEQRGDDMNSRNKLRPAAMFSRLGWLLAGVLIASAAQAQDAYPNRPIRLVLPFAAGGGTDVLARIIAQKMSAGLGQTVVVDNRTGANGMVATAAVAKASADGYTVLMMNAGLAQNPAIQPSMPYRTEELAPVAQLTLFPSAFAVSTGSGINTLADLIQLARSNPSKVSFGSWGIGSGGHFYGEVFNRAAKINMLHVPYKGEALALTDLLGGRITAMFGSPGIIAPYVTAGKLKILAQTAPRRLQAYPDVPSFSEAGYPAVSLSGWSGFFVPAATPKPVVDK